MARKAQHRSRRAVFDGRASDRRAGLLPRAHCARPRDAPDGRWLRTNLRPVASVIRVDNVEEALNVANETEFGLGAALWTGNLARAKTLARRIEAEVVFINGITASDAWLPFGGIKRSGYGRELRKVCKTSEPSPDVRQ